MRASPGLLLCFLLGGCANFTAVPTLGRENINGLRVYSPKTFVVVNGSGVSSIVVPDCSKEYALQFSSFLAKNDVLIDLTNGMVTKIDNKQDTTAFPIKIVDAVVEAAKAGKSLGTAFSVKAEGGVANRLGVYELSCERGQLVATQAITEASLLRMQTSAPVNTPRATEDDDEDEVDSTPIPKR
jgi:hypothetical protein